jgi:hypothetical protein
MNSLKSVRFAWLLIGWVVGCCAIPADAQNSPPTISPIANRTVNEDAATGPIIISVQDAETPAANLSVEAVASNPQLVPWQNISIGGTGGIRFLQILPARNQFGTTTITTVVRDSGGASATNSFILTVTAVNDPPTLDPIPDLILEENAPLQTIDLSGISSGAQNESQLLSVSAVSSAPTIVSHPAISYTSPDRTGTLSIEPQPNVAGIVTITVTVDDGVSLTTQSFSVVVGQVIQHGMLDFSAPNYRVNEDIGSAEIQVIRTGGSAGMVTVQYRTLSGSAVAGLDYQSTSGVLAFASGETNKTIRIPIINDALAENDETLSLVLTNATGGASLLGVSATATLTIAHSDGPLISRPLLNAPQREGDILRFTFTGEPAYDYFVEFSDLLSPSANWQTLTNFRAKLQPIEAIVTDSVGQDGSRFYRIRKQDCQCE